VQTRHARESAIVAKDPVSLKYHRMRPDEYFVLRQLESVSSLKELRERYEGRYAPDRVTEAQLNQLLFRFHQNGLVISDATGQGDRLDDRRRKDRWDRWKQRLSGILFIRFPGVDPEPLLGRLYPFCRPWLGRTGAAIALTVLALAAVLFLGNWDRFAAEFPQMESWIRWEAVLVLACVIGLTKVCHELGHAIACKHFGGECHQIGPMLLVFTPALYCDTTDSWMMVNRFHRAMVGLAGIAVEVCLAAVATIVWSMTGPGTTHYAAMNVMLVCSVSTVLFNANPLLRYDGYYVLSDLWDVPNLGERSRKTLASTVARLAFGVKEEGPDQDSARFKAGLLTYAIASFVYRWALTLVILWFVSVALRPYRLESLGRMIVLFAAGGMLAALLRGPIQFLKNPSKRHRMKMRRLTLTMVVLGLVMASAFVPYRSTVTADGRITPRNEVRVYVATAGDLDDLRVAPGDAVQRDQTLAVLSNPDRAFERLVAESRVATQEAVVDSLQTARLETSEAADQLPAALSLLEDLQAQAERARQRVEALKIKAPVAGSVLAAPRQEKAADPMRLVTWSGEPTAGENLGCTLESGTELLSLADADQWNAMLVLDQSDVIRIAMDAHVKVFLDAAPGITISGKVAGIARSRWNPEQNADRRDNPEAARRNAPLSTSYTVRVELDDAPIQPVTGAIAVAKIQADEVSLAGRLFHHLSRMFRFR